MCNQNTAMGLQGAGVASSALGAYFGAQSSKLTLEGQADTADINARMVASSADANRTIAEINARTLEKQAQGTLLTGQREEQKARIATANLKGKQRATLAANGVDLGAGSAENIQTTTDVMGEIDASTIAANAVMSAWGYRTQASNVKAQALIDDANAKTSITNLNNQARTSRSASSAISPETSAFTSLMGGAGQVAASWYKMKGG